MVNFTIGCDPELFFKKNNQPISAHGLIPGNKAEPHKTDGGAVQVDGMAAEFNTDPVPLADFESFNVNIIKQIKKLKEIVGPDVSLSIVPVMDFSQELMDEQPEVAKELGCDPDYNAYTLKPNPRPKGDDVLFRSGAGHIHIGWGADIPVDNEDHIKICADFVKVLDSTVGLFMTYIDREPRRRELYGKAGAFRPKPYGVEYRTPSNLWIINRDRRSLVHKLVNLAISCASNPYLKNDIYNLDSVPAEEIINNGNFEAAEAQLDHLLSGTPAWAKTKSVMRTKEAA